MVNACGKYITCAFPDQKSSRETLEIPRVQKNAKLGENLFIANNIFDIDMFCKASLLVRATLVLMFRIPVSSVLSQNQ